MTSYPVTSQDDERRKLYGRYINYCNEHNFKAMEQFYTEPININDQPWKQSDVTKQFEPLVAAFPDWHWEIRNFAIDGDLLSLHFEVSGTHKGTFQGIEPTGKKVKAQQFTLYHLVNGKFVDVWDMTDFEAIVKQLRS
jgi:predicted ester cyclase